MADIDWKTETAQELMQVIPHLHTEAAMQKASEALQAAYERGQRESADTALLSAAIEAGWISRLTMEGRIFYDDRDALRAAIEKGKAR